MLGIAVFLGLVLFAGWAVSARDAAWRERVRVLAAVRPVALRTADGAGLVARDQASASTLLVRLIADRGSTVGLRLSVRSLPAPPAPGFAAVDFDARGPEAQLIALARAIEGERPAMRLVRWAIRPVAGGALRLEARAVAPIEFRR
ncbi:hypothetical protein Q4F19_04395 [Sphingomonas sp. BIUV-7]|uniref:Nitrogen fixation protein FixH n=1 Tax=Sphingomonas natans TaxID=3063330 RepID=A0ABT8Y5N4_9SPHN|nr:hypothetical protein [Sphingomonas sp. BIUV-7]MDO6413616.1 hypothetical protein [Sphingomonas sp. BIUV-7]